MSREALKYSAPGARPAVSAEDARSLARRRQMARSLSDDAKAPVSVDLAEMRHARPQPGGRQAGNIALLAARIVILKAEIARLEARVTDFELQETAGTTAAGEMTARLLPTGSQTGDSIDNHEQASRRLGHLAASIIEADRKACR